MNGDKLKTFLSTATASDYDVLFAADIDCLIEQSTDIPLLLKIGFRLWTIGRAAQANAPFSKAFNLGERSRDFIYQYVGYLTGEMRYRDLFAVIDTCKAPADRSMSDYLDMMSGQAKLAEYYDRETTIQRAERRRRSGRWLDVGEVVSSIRKSIDEKAPFSLVRIGDGEAKLAVYHDRHKLPFLSTQEASAIGDNIWVNWFGSSISKICDERFHELYERYLQALTNASVLGVVDYGRLRADTAHFGYMAHQDVAVEEMVTSSETKFTDSMVHYQLNAASPFLEPLLRGLGRLSVIGPHQSMAERLCRRYEIPEARAYVVPGERRLPASFFDNVGSHYPERYGELVKELNAIEPGDVTLVAAGFLGKIYCDFVKRNGGIAIDIGSIADGWMGINTRPGQLDQVGTL